MLPTESSDEMVSFSTNEAPAFAEQFARSAAFTRDPTSPLHQLSEYEGSLLPYARAIEVSVEQLSGPLAEATQSIAHRHGMVGRDIATILLRLYQQSEGAMAASINGTPYSKRASEPAKMCLQNWIHDSMQDRARIRTCEEERRSCLR